MRSGRREYNISNGSTIQSNNVAEVENPNTILGDGLLDEDCVGILVFRDWLEECGFVFIEALDEAIQRVSNPNDSDDSKDKSGDESSLYIEER